MYTISPAEELKKIGVETIINISASPFSYIQDIERKKTLRFNAVKHNLSIVYCNHIGAQTELIFDGGSFFMNAKGEVTKQGSLFSEDLVIENEGVDASPLPRTKIELIHDALVLGIKDYFRKSNFTKVVLGLSGGIDSAVTFTLASKALGATNVLGVLMPSEFSSDHSIKDAEDLVLNLGASKITLPIKSTYSSFESELSDLFVDQKFDVTEENLQARIRGTFLMDILEIKEPFSFL